MDTEEYTTPTRKTPISFLIVAELEGPSDTFKVLFVKSVRPPLVLLKMSRTVSAVVEFVVFLKRPTTEPDWALDTVRSPEMVVASKDEDPVTETPPLAVNTPLNVAVVPVNAPVRPNVVPVMAFKATAPVPLTLMTVPVPDKVTDPLEVIAPIVVVPVTVSPPLAVNSPLNVAVVPVRAPVRPNVVPLMAPKEDEPVTVSPPLAANSPLKVAVVPVRAPVRPNVVPVMAFKEVVPVPLTLMTVPVPDRVSVLLDVTAPTVVEPDTVRPPLAVTSPLKLAVLPVSAPVSPIVLLLTPLAVNDPEKVAVVPVRAPVRPNVVPVTALSSETPVPVTDKTVPDPVNVSVSVVLMFPNVVTPLTANPPSALNNPLKVAVVPFTAAIRFRLAPRLTSLTKPSTPNCMICVQPADGDSPTCNTTSLYLFPTSVLVENPN